MLLSPLQWLLIAHVRILLIWHSFDAKVQLAQAEWEAGNKDPIRQAAAIQECIKEYSIGLWPES